MIAPSRWQRTPRRRRKAAEQLRQPAGEQIGDTGGDRLESRRDRQARYAQREALKNVIELLAARGRLREGTGHGGGKRPCARPQGVRASAGSIDDVGQIAGIRAGRTAIEAVTIAHRDTSSSIASTPRGRSARRVRSPPRSRRPVRAASCARTARAQAAARQVRNRSPVSRERVAISFRHARPCAGHPRLPCPASAKAWMAGTSPAMTR